jgi:hypothetical protein
MIILQKANRHPIRQPISQAHSADAVYPNIFLPISEQLF